MASVFGGMASKLAGYGTKKKNATRKSGAMRSNIGTLASSAMGGAGKPKLGGGPGAAIASAMPKIKPMTTRPKVTPGAGRKTKKIQPMRRARKY